MHCLRNLTDKASITEDRTFIMLGTVYLVPQCLHARVAPSFGGLDAQSLRHHMWFFLSIAFFKRIEHVKKHTCSFDLVALILNNGEA